MLFRWVDWNIEHIAQHGVSAADAEWVVRHPARGCPRKHRGGYLVWGCTLDGKWLQVAFVRDVGSAPHRAFVYHARPLTSAEKRRIAR